MPATIAPRIGRVVIVALLAASAALLGASAAQAQAQATDFSWTSVPDDFSWTSTPDDFSWT